MSYTHDRVRLLHDIEHFKIPPWPEVGHSITTALRFGACGSRGKVTCHFIEMVIMTGAQSFLEKDQNCVLTGQPTRLQTPSRRESKRIIIPLPNHFGIRVVLSLLCQIALEPGVLGHLILLLFRVHHSRERQALQSALFRLCAVTVNYSKARHAGLLLPLHFNS
jgi:hypothetical protein